MLGTKVASSTSAGGQGPGEEGAQLSGETPREVEATGEATQRGARESPVLVGPSVKAGGTSPDTSDRRPARWDPAGDARPKMEGRRRLAGGVAKAPLWAQPLLASLPPRPPNKETHNSCTVLSILLLSMAR